MPTEDQKIIAYYRVSTKKQGESGLGLEAQEDAVEQFRMSNQGITIASYREIESGKRSDRPEIAKAIAHAKRSNATLVIAKLDRLSRNVAFTATLLETRVKFKACDNPHADNFTIHILAAVAEQEAKAISQRTKAALGRYKARGGKLGAARDGAARLTPDLMAKGRKRAAMLARQRANQVYADLLGQVGDLRRSGLSHRAIAAALNADGQTTRRGKPWSGVQVMRLLRRAGLG